MKIFNFAPLALKAGRIKSSFDILYEDKHFSANLRQLGQKKNCRGK